MKVSQKIERQISKKMDGATFRYQQLSIDSNEYNAAAKAIERLIEKGIIKRISTGIFYKPKQTIFGELKPNEEELLKSYLFQNKKRIAYVTGVSLYNRMGLTAQVPRSMKIASRDKRITIAVGNIRANPVKSYVDVTDKNFHLLGILDALKDFTRIPDLDRGSGVKIISNQLKKLNEKELKKLIDCALSYPPRARAFLGSLLEQIDFCTNLKTIILKRLKESLNPFSEYKYGIDESMLPTINKWNIK